MQDRKIDRIQYIAQTPGACGEPYDFSASGISCFFDQAIESGTKIRLKVNDTQIIGKVAYCRRRSEGFRLGIEFVEVNSTQRQRLDDIVESFSTGTTITCHILSTSI
jgi:hypothetical protein